LLFGFENWDALNAPSRFHAFPPVLKNCIALAPAFAQHPSMLARVLSAAVNGIEAFPVEVEVNCGWGDTLIVIAGLPASGH
jgi:hypothetical protein